VACPARIRRLEMFAPIRPNPTTPICIGRSCFHGPVHFARPVETTCHMLVRRQTVDALSRNLPMPGLGGL